MNVEIEAEAALFPEKEYIIGIVVTVPVVHFEMKIASLFLEKYQKGANLIIRGK